MKVDLIRCLQTEDTCPGTACLKVMREKKLTFNGITEGIETIGINTCGGCPNLDLTVHNRLIHFKKKMR